MLSNRKFGFVFAAIFLLIGLYSIVWGTSRFWPLVLAVVFFIAACAFPHQLTHLNKAWARFGQVTYIVTTMIILAFTFFLIVWPIGLALSAFGRRPMQEESDVDTQSYWRVRELQTPSKEFFDNQF